METAKLSIVTGPFKGKIINVDKDVIILGREESCDIYFPNNNVSRKHAKIIKVEKGFELHDLSSRNGTFLNDQRISEMPLNNGDRIVIGGFMLAFYIDAPTLVGKIFEDEESDEDDEDDIMIDTQMRQFFDIDAEKHSRTYEQVSKDVGAVYRSGLAINANIDLNAIYASGIDVMLDEIPLVDFCSMHILQENTYELICVKNSYRDKEKKKVVQQSFSRRILQKVLRDRKSILTNHSSDQDNFDKSASLITLDIKSTMCVPIQHRDKLIGLLQANTKSIQHTFTENTLEFLSAVGLQLGSAIENATLFQKLREEKDELNLLNEKLKNTQEGLIQSERLAAIGQLSTGLVHDIKNPMTIIKGHASLLKEVCKSAGTEFIDGFNVIESLNSIEQGAEHCNDVVNQVLKFAKQAPPEKIYISINALLDETITFLSHEINSNSVKIYTDFDDSIGDILADSSQIKQVIINIILNAIQAMTENPELYVVSCIEKHNGVKCIAIKIQDNGCGMTEKIKEDIFEPFFSTKDLGEGYGGSGMGLAVSFGIIQNHGGEIIVDSVVDEGTRFTIYLPRA